jgi:putative acetyltransferase
MPIRPATNADLPGIIRVIRDVYDEHGDIFDLERFDNDLQDIEAAYIHGGECDGDRSLLAPNCGAFVVLEIDGVIQGTHAAFPRRPDEGVAGFRRLYLDKELRGTGAGRELMDWAIDWARANGFRAVEFHSDYRFTRAHAFFKSYGFVQGELRQATEENPYTEYFFRLEL